jgi:hypothetical protein
MCVVIIFISLVFIFNIYLSVMCVFILFIFSIYKGAFWFFGIFGANWGRFRHLAQTPTPTAPMERPENPSRKTEPPPYSRISLC